MANNLIDQCREIATLQSNLNDLETKLKNSNKRILELSKDSTATKEELESEKQLLVELKTQYKRAEFETNEAIEDQIDDWPDVLDSRPQKRYKTTEEWS